MKKTQKPNILLIFSDQQHWHALGFKDEFFDTPNIDKFVKSAVVFNNAFCSTPQCSPSRSTLMTGYYPSKTGVIGNIGSAGGNDLTMPTFGKILQENGYYTGYFGKWHLGHDEGGRAGWDKKKMFRSDFLAKWKSKFFLRDIKRGKNEGKPFALVTSIINPHDIYRFLAHKTKVDHEEIPLPESWEQSAYEDKPSIHLQFLEDDQGKNLHGKPKKRWKQYRDCYREKVKKFDKAVGKILNKLKRIGEYENTIVIVTSDHGDMDTHNKQLFKGPFMFDHLMRIPLMIRVPERFGGKGSAVVEDFMTVNTDMVPTILDFAGVDYDEGDYPNGTSLKPFLVRRDAKKDAELPKRDRVFCQYYSKQKWVNPIRTIRTLDYKYNLYLPEGEELYDLKEDPGECTNLANDPKYSEIKSDLRKKLEKWIEKNDDPFFSQQATDRKGNPLSS